MESTEIYVIKILRKNQFLLKNGSDSFFLFLKADYQNNKIQSPWNVQNGGFTFSKFSKIDFTWNLSDKKIL